MSMELNEISENNANILTNQKGEHLVIDLGSIDTQSLLNEGEKQSYTNNLTAREMDSLTALCDTMLPAVDPPETTTDESVLQFYKTSAAMTGTPEHIGRMISHRLRHHLFLLRLLFFMLSTKLGTFVFGGIHSLSPRFPFFHKFSELSLVKRQRIILSMSTSCLFLYRMAFIGIRLLILLAFFTQVDENEENPSWKAIGYCGPDPEFKSKKQNKSNQPLGYLTPKSSHNSPNTETQKQAQEQPKEDLYGPLYKGVVNVQNPQDILVESLKRSGLHVSLNHKKKSNKNQVMTIHCDAVVVGSGSGGGLISGALASAGYKVVVLEKGDYCARTNLSLLEGPTLDKMYEGAGLLSTRDLGVTILAGSTVGGGSAINWSASIRTPPHVIREWANVHELEIFESPLYKEALDVVCKKMEVQSDISDEGFNNAVLRKGCMEMGYPIVDIPRNAPTDHYCGWCCFGCKDGRKKGTCETWLKDVIDSGNGVILTGCEVEKVLYERKRGRNRDTAKGVMFEYKSNNNGLKKGSSSSDRLQCVVEAKATIVACGALNTPALLKKSGLKNPNIGKNLHLHPVVMAWGYFPDTEPLSSLLLEEGNVWPQKEKKSYEGGIMTAMSTVVSEFNGSGYGAVIQTPSLHPGLFSAIIPWTSGSDIKHRMTKFSRTAHIFALARDVGSGVISTSPFDITYKMDPIDEANLKKGIEKMLRILAGAGAEEIGTHHHSGASINVKKVSCHEFETFVKKESSKAIQGHSTIASAHQMGSCKMGVDPRTSVVNQRGECWEVEGLYLADSSVFPTALGVNPMVTVQAISYCTTQSVLEYLKRKKKR